MKTYPIFSCLCTSMGVCVR